MGAYNVIDWYVDLKVGIVRIVVLLLFGMLYSWEVGKEQKIFYA